MAELQAAIDDANKHLKGTDNDHKVGALQTLEAELRSVQGQDVDAQALESIAALIKTSLRNGNSRVYTAGLACAVVFFNVADEQWQTTHSEGHPTSHLDFTFKNAVHTLAVPPGGLLTFLGDAKDSVRASARAALLQAAKTSVAISASESRLPPDQMPLAMLDKLMKEQGFGSKNAKVREQSLLYLTELRAACPTLPLRAWMPVLVNALEDSDPVVRDVARESVITIFTAPSVGAAAKADLKKELIKKGVRKTTSDIVLRRTLGSGVASSSSSLTGSPPSAYGALGNDSMSSGRRTPLMSGQQPLRPPSVASMGRSPSSSSLPRPSIGDSSSAFKPARGDRLLKKPKDLTNEEILANIEAMAAANAPPPSTGEENVVQVVYIASARDLEQEFAAMGPCFVGKETEFNWQEREKAIFRMRGMLKGDAHHTYRTTFVSSLKGMVEAILKATNSLRTTLAVAACQLITELAENLKEGILPLFELLYAGQLKLASLTKKVTAQAAQDSVTALLKESPYHSKSLLLLSPMLDSKNTAARSYAAQHIKTIIETQGKAHREAIENTPNAGLPLLSQMLKKVLTDASPAVKESGRATFWLVHDIWPGVAQGILDSVDSTTRKAIEKAHPRPSRQPLASLAKVEGSATKKAAAPRPSMRELISSRRAAQVSSSDTTSTHLSSSVPASASSLAQPTEVYKSNLDTPTSRPSHQKSNLSESPPPARPRLSATKTTPTKRPMSFYGASPSSHIPSPPRSSHTSPRSRTFSGEHNQRQNVSQTYKSPQLTSRSIPQSATPTQATFDQKVSAQSAMQRPSSSRSSSPPLQNPTGNVDYSDIEASTFNGMPDGLDSTDDESVNLLDYKPVALTSNNHGHADYDMSERSRILDGLMDTSFESVDNTEVEEAVKGRAEQAEQTAHRFLELTEPENDIDQESVGEATFIQSTSAQDIPVPYTPEAQARRSDASLSASNYQNHTNAVTPLLERLQRLHLVDSPARTQPADAAASVLATFGQDRWWIDKANLAVAHGLPELNADLEGRTLDDLADVLSTPNVQSRDLLQLARISKALPVGTVADTEAGKPGSVWTRDDLYRRSVDLIRQLLKEDHDVDIKFHCLVALLNMVTNQAPLIDGREMGLLETLLDVGRADDKTTRTGAETVLLSLMERTEPLYGTSCLRVSLQHVLESQALLNGHANMANEEAFARSLGMGLKALSALFSVLPSEVLEEEIPRSREILLKAINSPQTSLRQTAATVIVKAHLVIQDDAKLFNLLDGLTKSQMNLCTYLFARSTSNS